MTGLSYAAPDAQLDTAERLLHELLHRLDHPDHIHGFSLAGHPNHAHIDATRRLLPFIGRRFSGSQGSAILRLERFGALSALPPSPGQTSPSTAALTFALCSHTPFDLLGMSQTRLVALQCDRSSNTCYLLPLGTCLGSVTLAVHLAQTHRRTPAT